MDPRPSGERQDQSPSRSPVEPLSFSSGVLLGEEHLDVIAEFTCARRDHNETRFERDVSDWLKDTQGGALQAVRLGLSEVRLFFCQHTGALMGFGAIGMEKWRFPDGKEVPLWVLHTRVPIHDSASFPTAIST